MKGFLLDENLPGQLAFTPALPVIHALDLGDHLTDSGLWLLTKSWYLVTVEWCCGRVSFFREGWHRLA